jgi:hypothetical protein
LLSERYSYNCLLIIMGSRALIFPASTYDILFLSSSPVKYRHVLFVCICFTGFESSIVMTSVPSRFRPGFSFSMIGRLTRFHFHRSRLHGDRRSSSSMMMSDVDNLIRGVGVLPPSGAPQVFGEPRYFHVLFDWPSFNLLIVLLGSVGFR